MSPNTSTRFSVLEQTKGTRTREGRRTEGEEGGEGGVKGREGGEGGDAWLNCGVSVQSSRYS